MAAKKGKISLEEKYIAQGMLSKGKTLEDIEKFLGREGNVSLKVYIEKELDKLQDTVVSARLDVKQQLIDSGTLKRIEHQLVKMGIHAQDAARILITVTEELTEVPTEEELHALAIKSIKAGAYMGKQGRYKVEATVMSKVASERADFAREQGSSKVVSRSARGNIYNPSTGEIE